MEIWNPESDNNLVDAIEEGKIVKVTEEYARLECLPILRKQTPKIHISKKKQKEDEPRLSFDDFRKPLNWRKSQVLSELMENFHWQISKRRRQLGLARRQLAQRINESEYHIKMIENGTLPKDDFVIINKLQIFLGINLRKDKKDFNKPARSLIKEENLEEIKKDRLSKEDNPTFSGNEIQLLEEG